MQDDVEALVAGLTKAQRRLLLAMRSSRPKKWRAIYRDAKVRHWTQLPFSLARPTLTGFECLTPLGLRVRDALRQEKSHD
jgi:hypothetical protein